MAKYRPVYTEFWTDPKVSEEMTPEDRYFMLYLLTNTHTTQIGMYMLTKKVIAFELGYSPESVKSLLDRFENHHKLIKYNEETREILLLNWAKYNLASAGKPVLDLIKKEIKEVRCKEFIEITMKKITNEKILQIFTDHLGIGEENPPETPDDMINNLSTDTTNDTFDDTSNGTCHGTSTTSGQNENENEKKDIHSECVHEILNHWNSKDIKLHTGTKAQLEKIKKYLKKFSKEQIIQAIDCYSMIYYDPLYFYSNIWTLETFLKQSNGVPAFLPDGKEYIRYFSKKEKGTSTVSQASSNDMERMQQESQKRLDNMRSMYEQAGVNVGS